MTLPVLENLKKEADRLIATGVFTPGELVDYMLGLGRSGNCGAQILEALRQL